MERKSEKYRYVLWLSQHPFLVLAIILAASLGPFVNKAVQTDDALFVWAGQWIQHHPLDFYGGKANWWVSALPMWMDNWNPPLTSYFLAGVASIFGWHEIPLHIACIGVAFAAAAGIYNLAKMWCARPLMATLIAIFTPAFLVSSSTLMCDVPMLALWVWSLVIFARAFEADARWLFALAGLLAGLAVLTKYCALMLLPLMAAMALLRARKAGWWLLSLIIPAVIAGLYELLTAKLYGRGLFFAASRYASSFHDAFPGGTTAKVIIGLAFAGGSLLPILLLAPWLWTWRIRVLGGAVFLALIGFFSFYNPGLIDPWVSPETWQDWRFRLEVALLVIAGAQLILIAFIDTLQQRDSVSVTLVLWTTGVFVFATLINWSINARGFLPLCPAVAILAVRRFDAVKRYSILPRSLLVPMPLAVFVSLSLVVADYQTANTTRAVAEQIARKYSAKGRQLWIEGHWGFQYYMQKLGAKPVDIELSDLEPGDTIAVNWSSNLNAMLPSSSVGVLDAILPNTKSWMALSGRNRFGLAGFYDAGFGPVPFVIGESGPGFFIAKVLSKVQYHTRPSNEQNVKQNAALPEFSKLDWTVEPKAAPAENPIAKKQLGLAAHFQQAGKEHEAAECCCEALAADPDNAQALNNLAWILATSRDPTLRDPPKAVQLAARAVTLTQCRDPIMIGTLSAALAEHGDFAKAVDVAHSAMYLAQLTGRLDVAASNAKLMELFANGKTVGSL